MNNVEKCHRALLSLSEEFRTKSPPDLKSSMQCLQAILNLPGLENCVIAKTNFHLGAFIYKYTNDVAIAQSYLQRAFEQSQFPELVSLRLQISSLLVDVFLIQNQGQQARQILMRAINDTSTNSGGQFNLYWYYRFVLKLAHLNLEDKDYLGAVNLLSNGVSAATAINDSYAKMLFLLSKTMVLMIARKYSNSLVAAQQQHLPNFERETNVSLVAAGELLQSWQTDAPEKQIVEVFFLVLQVCHHFNKGQNKSARPYLRLLQQSIQNITNPNDQHSLSTHADSISTNMAENFFWMPKDHIRVLVYIISVLHSMQNGSVERAQNYSHQALIEIGRLPKLDDLLSSFQILLYEHMSMFHLVMGNRTAAIRDTVQAIQLCYQSTPQTKVKHKGNIRSLLGLYAMSMSMSVEAEEHFKSVMNDMNVDTDTRLMSILNLALCYLQDDSLRDSRRHDLEILLNQIDPNQLNSHTVRASAFYVLGLKAFCDSQYEEAKRNIRQSLEFTSKEEIQRLTSCSLIMIGRIFYIRGRLNETSQVLNAGLNLFKKVGDVHGQLWAASVFKELYSSDINSPKFIEFSSLQENLSSSLHQDRLRASSSQEHNYIRWSDWH